MSGEYTTAAAFALWLACEIIGGSEIPGHMIKHKANSNSCKCILIYNNYKGLQHSFMLIKKVE